MSKHHFFSERKFSVLYHEVFRDLNLIQAEYKDAFIFMPKTKRLKKSVLEAQKNGHFEMIQAYPNIHQFVSKSHLWINLILSLGFNTAFRFAPNTYILRVARDIQRLKKEYDPNETYLLKGNKQRRRGIKKLESLEQLDQIDTTEFVIVQKLIKNSYKIKEHRFNIRFYVIFRSYQNDHFYQLFSDGKMIYTKAEGDIEQLYISSNENYHDELPHSYQAFQKYLKDLGENTELMNKMILHLIRSIFSKCSPKMTEGISPEIKFTELFGVDILIDENLHPKILEINKSPQMGFKNEAEKEFKYKLLTNLYSFYTASNIDQLQFSDQEMFL